MESKRDKRFENNRVYDKSDRSDDNKLPK